MTGTPTIKHAIIKFSGDSSSNIDDSLAPEEPLEVCLKQFDGKGNSEITTLMVTMRTPGDDIVLVRGWLFTSGIAIADDILSIHHVGQDLKQQGQSNRVLITIKPGHRIDASSATHVEYTNSSCGICGQQSIEQLLERLPERSRLNRISIPASALYPLLESLRQNQPLFEQTGSCHGVGLFDESMQLIDVLEDVGRHNALDKLIGKHMGMFPGKYGLLVSGRVSFEIVQKAAMAQISMIIAVGAPTDLAVELCKECDIALIGFVKENSFNLYCGQRQLAGY